MEFCSNCEKELTDDKNCCESCGTPVVNQPGTDEKTSVDTFIEGDTTDAKNGDVEITERAPSVKGKKKFAFSKKFFIIGGAVLAVLLIAAVIIGNIVSSNMHKEKLNMYREKFELAFDKMTYGAQKSEAYATLERKVWRNCIYEDGSAETDKYTKDGNGRFYDDFNDALSSFYDGESLNWLTILANSSEVDTLMAELKDCPEEFEDEYRALKELYIAYSGLTDLVLGDSSYSYNSFSEALENARSDYKNALSSTKLLIG